MLSSIQLPKRLMFWMWKPSKEMRQRPEQESRICLHRLFADCQGDQEAYQQGNGDNGDDTDQFVPARMQPSHGGSHFGGILFFDA